MSKSAVKILKEVRLVQSKVISLEPESKTT